MSDYANDAKREKWLEEKEAIRQARRDYCDRDCDGHNENCPYYDAEEETWDFEECFRDRGGC